jgi:hypothetical protein
MAKPTPGLSFDRAGDDYVLRRTTENGKTSSLTLSLQETITLAELSPGWRDAVLQSLPDGGGTVRRTVGVPVVGYHISSDIHGEIVVMALAPPSGPENIHLLRKAAAQELAQGLLEMVSHMDDGRPTKQ